MHCSMSTASPTSSNLCSSDADCPGNSICLFGLISGSWGPPREETQQSPVCVCPSSRLQAGFPSCNASTSAFEIETGLHLTKFVLIVFVIFLSGFVLIRKVWRGDIISHGSSPGSDNNKQCATVSTLLQALAAGAFQVASIAFKRKCALEDLVISNDGRKLCPSEMKRIVFAYLSVVFSLYVVGSLVLTWMTVYAHAGTLNSRSRRPQRERQEEERDETRLRYGLIGLYGLYSVAIVVVIALGGAIGVFAISTLPFLVILVTGLHFGIGSLSSTTAFSTVVRFTARVLSLALLIALGLTLAIGMIVPRSIGNDNNQAIILCFEAFLLILVGAVLIVVGHVWYVQMRNVESAAYAMARPPQIKSSLARATTKQLESNDLGFVTVGGAA